jgi:hypothetical protein
MVSFIILSNSYLAVPYRILGDILKCQLIKPLLHLTIPLLFLQLSNGRLDVTDTTLMSSFKYSPKRSIVLFSQYTNYNPVILSFNAAVLPDLDLGKP